MCRVHSENVRNNRARQLFELAIQLGDIIVAKVGFCFNVLLIRINFSVSLSLTH